jgi:hypothetical protein
MGEYMMTRPEASSQESTWGASYSEQEAALLCEVLNLNG